MKKVTVVLTTYNRPVMLDLSLKALNQQQIHKFNFEVIVVDDCSKDEYAKENESILNSYPNFIYVKNNKNSGLSASRNVGAKNSTGDFILFLDDDIIIDDQYVESHALVLDSEIPVATVGSLKFPDHLIKKNNLMRYMGSRELRQRDMGQDFLNDLPPQYFGGGICGMRSSDFIQIGGFNETYQFYGGEDVEMGYALKERGIKIIYVKNAKAEHYDNVQIDRYRSKYNEMGREGVKLIMQKDPDVFDGSSIKYLLPIKAKDSFQIKMIKFFAPFMFGKPIESLLRNIAYFTNESTYFYSDKLFHILMACWIYEGLQDKSTKSKSNVEYDN
jgi:glycosyltransferase involved in cell wall biosynthesis